MVNFNIKFAFDSRHPKVKTLNNILNDNVNPLGGNIESKSFFNSISASSSEPPITVHIVPVSEVVGNKVIYDWARYSSLADNFWTNSIVEIYRIVNGEIVKVETTTILSNISTEATLDTNNILIKDLLIVRQPTLYPSNDLVNERFHGTKFGLTQIRNAPYEGSWGSEYHWTGDDVNALAYREEDDKGYYVVYDLKDTSETRRISFIKTAGSLQTYYTVLRPGIRYRLEIEMWADNPVSIPMVYSSLQSHRILSIDGVDVTESFPINLNLTSEEKTFIIDFEVDHVLEATTVQRFGLMFENVGKFFIRAFRFYDSSAPFKGLTLTNKNRLIDSNLDHIRDHSLVKTAGIGNAYSVKGMIIDILHYSLQNTVELNIPRFWLQPEYHTVNEILFLMEYLCSETGEGAELRKKLGRFDPWITDLHFLFEISNETWNNMSDFYNFYEMQDSETGEVYTSNKVYGLFFQYYINEMKKSPYFNKNNFTFIIGGRFNSDYGDVAAVYCPDADVVTRAPYVRGWEVGASGVFDTPQGHFETLFWPGTKTIDRLLDNDLWLQEAIDLGANPNLIGGTYEDAISYSNLPPNIPHEEIVFSKTKTAATCWVDKIAQQSAKYTLQSEFTLNYGTSWASHHPVTDVTYPYHMWSKVFNNHCHGIMKEVKTLGVKTRNVKVSGIPYFDVPEIGIYVFENINKISFLIVNRNLPYNRLPEDDDLFDINDNGNRTIEIPLPESNYLLKKFYLTGDYNNQNFDQSLDTYLNIEMIEEVSETTKGVKEIIEAASAYLYVFEIV